MAVAVRKPLEDIVIQPPVPPGLQEPDTSPRSQATPTASRILIPPTPPAASVPADSAPQAGRLGGHEVAPDEPPPTPPPTDPYAPGGPLEAYAGQTIGTQEPYSGPDFTKIPVLGEIARLFGAPVTGEEMSGHQNPLLGIVTGHPTEEQQLAARGITGINPTDTGEQIAGQALMTGTQFLPGNPLNEVTAAALRAGARLAAPLVERGVAAAGEVLGRATENAAANVLHALPAESGHASTRLGSSYEGPLRKLESELELLGQEADRFASSDPAKLDEVLTQMGSVQDRRDAFLAMGERTGQIQAEIDGLSANIAENPGAPLLKLVATSGQFKDELPESVTTAQFRALVGRTITNAGVVKGRVPLHNAIDELASTAGLTTDEMQQAVRQLQRDRSRIRSLQTDLRRIDDEVRLATAPTPEAPAAAAVPEQADLFGGTKPVFAGDQGEQGALGLGVGERPLPSGVPSRPLTPAEELAVNQGRLAPDVGQAPLPSLPPLPSLDEVKFRAAATTLPNIEGTPPIVPPTASRFRSPAAIQHDIDYGGGMAGNPPDVQARLRQELSDATVDDRLAKAIVQRDRYADEPNDPQNNYGSRAKWVRELEQERAERDARLATPVTEPLSPGLTPTAGAATEPWQTPADSYLADRFPEAKGTLDGLKIRGDIPNTASISGYYPDYETIRGIRSIPLDELTTTYTRPERVTQLAKQIEASGEINPIIVGIDPMSGDLEVIEGQHRVAALQELGRKDVPAKVVVGLSSEGGSSHYYAVKQALAEGKPVPPEVLADYPDLAPKAAEAAIQRSAPAPQPLRASEVDAKFAERYAAATTDEGRQLIQQDWEATHPLSVAPPRVPVPLSAQELRAAKEPSKAVPSPAETPAGTPPLVPPTPPPAGGGGTHVPPGADTPGEFRPSASAANVPGLRTIQTGLSKRQQWENILKETLHIGTPTEEHATPAMAERTRIQPVIDAQAHVVAAQGDYRVRQTFVTDVKGRITDLKNASFPDGPTIQDVAARLPEFADRLTPGQTETMQWLKDRMAPYRQLWEELGARDIGFRSDVQEGGFYLPRGRADIEGADQVAKVSGGPTRRGKGGFEKPAVFDSQAEGIGKGFEYANLHDALYSYIKEVGSRAADQHIANYLQAATDAEGKLMASTMADRIDPTLRDAVQTLRAKIAGRTTTLIRQNARSGVVDQAGQKLQDILNREGQRTGAYAQGVTDRGTQATEAATGRVAGAETKSANVNQAAATGTLYVGKNDTTEGILATAQAELNTLTKEAARTARYAQGEATRAEAMSAGQQGRLSKDAARAQQRAAAAQSRADATQNALDGFKQDMSDLSGRWQKAQDRARATPRGMGNVDLVELQGTAFPDVLANAANKVLADEKQTSGKLANTIKVIEANNNLQRGMGATLDNSGPGIQGLLGAAADPVAYAKALGVNIKAWGRGGDQILGSFLKDFDAASMAKGLPTSVDWTREQLHYGGASTEFQVGSGMGRLTQAIENAPVIRQANRAFGYFGDALRTNWAQDELVTAMQRTGKTWQELRDSGDMQSIADAVNKATGWSPNRAAGDLGEFLLFAPRFLQSRLETAVNGMIGMVKGPLGAVGIGPGNTLEQQIARNSLLKMMGYGTMLTVAANSARGYDTDFNPLVKDSRTGDMRYNPNFMRIRNVGGRDWSLFGPWDSLLALFVNTASGHPVDALRGLASGSVGEAWDLLSGRDFTGNPVPNTPSAIAKNPGRFAQWIASVYTPFSWQNMPQTVQVAQKGDYGGAAVNVVGDVLGVKGSPLSYTDLEVVAAHQLGMTKDDGSPIVTVNDLSKGQRDQIKNTPDVLAKAAAFPVPDKGTVAQQGAGSFERLKQVNAEAEAKLRKNLDQGMFGKPLRTAIDAMKTQRYDYAHALLTSEILAAAKRENIPPRDAFAEAYLNVPMNELGTQGKLDFATFDKDRAAILAQAVAAGVPENYITGAGEGTYRGQRFQDPVVRTAVERLDNARKLLRPYYAIEDKLRASPQFKPALQALDAATTQARLDQVKTQYKTQINAFDTELTKEHHAWRTQNKTVDKLGVEYGYWPTTIDKVKTAAVAGGVR